MTAESYGCLTAKLEFRVKEEWRGAWQKEGKRKRRKLSWYCLYSAMLCQCPLWTGTIAKEVRRQQGQERERDLLQTKQCVSSEALLVPAWLWSQSEEPGCSESLGFYNKMHHYPGIIPSSEYGQQISYYCFGQAEACCPSVLCLSTVTLVAFVISDHYLWQFPELS